MPGRERLITVAAGQLLHDAAAAEYERRRRSRRAESGLASQPRRGVSARVRVTIDALARSGKLESVTGVGDVAWLRNNQNLFGELLVKVGPHLLTVQADISRGKTFDTLKPTLLELGKAFAVKLR